MHSPTQSEFDRLPATVQRKVRTQLFLSFEYHLDCCDFRPGCRQWVSDLGSGVLVAALPLLITGLAGGCLNPLHTHSAPPEYPLSHE